MTAYTLFMMTAGWVAFNFFYLCVEGTIVIRESIVWLRTIEFVAALGVFALAIERWISFVKGGQGKWH